MSHTICVTRIVLRPLSALFGLQFMLPMCSWDYTEWIFCSFVYKAKEGGHARISFNSHLLISIYTCRDVGVNRKGWRTCFKSGHESREQADRLDLKMGGTFFEWTEKCGASLRVGPVKKVIWLLSMHLYPQTSWFTEYFMLPSYKFSFF